MCLPSAEGASDQRLNLHGMRWARRDERRFLRGMPFNERHSRFQKVAKTFGNVPGEQADWRTFQKVSGVYPFFMPVLPQTTRYQPQRPVVEHKGLLRGCGLFSGQPIALVELGSTRCRGIRLDEPLIGRVERAAKAGGFSNPSAFIRAAIQRELAGRENEVEAAEERIAGSLDRLARETRSVKLAHQALFAFVDSLVSAAAGKIQTGQEKL